MSDIKQNNDYSQPFGLNTDDQHWGMRVPDSPYFLNIMRGEDGSTGVITNAMGNTQVAYTEPLTLSKVYFTLGAYYNNLRRKLYFFVFSLPYDSGAGVYLHDNRLLCYNEDTGTIDTIFKDLKNWFGLDPAQHLTDIRMIESWLFFNPVTDQPKMIDVDMAYNYTNYPAFDDTDLSYYANVGEIVTWKGGLFVANHAISPGQSPSASPTYWDRIGDSYQDESTIGVTEFDRAFFALKVPPVDRLSVAYGSDTTKNFNNVRGVVFRFCHRYQYFDNSYSVCSAYSALSLPLNDETYNGDLLSGITTNNYIKLTFSLYSAALVKNIEILFQEIGGDWKRAVIIDRRAQATLDELNYTYNFYNNDTYPTADQTMVATIQDAIPRLASTQEIINKNVLTFGGCTEGFDNLDKGLMDIDLTPTPHTISAEYGISVTKRNNISSNDILYNSNYDDITGVWYYWTIINIKPWFAGASLASNDIYEGVLEGRKFTRVLSAGDVATAHDFGEALVALYGTVITASLLDDGSVIQAILESNYAYPSLTSSFVYTPTASISSLTKKGGFKTGADHPFCRFYYDEALRRSNAQVYSGSTVYVPSVNDNSPAMTNVAVRWSIDWAVNDEPPTWAKYWRWGYAGNSRCDSFVQYIIASIADGSTDVNKTVKIDITPLQTIRTTTTTTYNCFPNSVIPSYSFTQGDRIRFITQKTNPTVSGTKIGVVIDGIYDFEILKFDDATNMIYVADFNYSGANIGENSLVEIYTPKKKNQIQTYYEFGDLMPIVLDADGNLCHGGKIQNQELGVSPIPATGSFEYGDVYHILRTPSKPLSRYDVSEYTVGDFHESMGWSDFYDSDDWDRGKLGLESAVGEVYLPWIRYSDTFLPQTKINGLTTFSVSDTDSDGNIHFHYKELNNVYGKIVSMQEVGDTLKCYQEKKASSIQIGRTEYYDTQGGSTTPQLQSFVLGSIRYQIPNYGTTFPESIAKNNRKVYGFDIYNGLVWQDSANGIFPISGRYADIGQSADYKMQTYFKQKAKDLLASGVDHCHVLGVWDEEYKMYIISFKDLVNSENDETVIFHEPSDRWISFTEFFYTPQEGWNQILELTYSVVKGFENGIGYVFDKESRFATFNIGNGVGTSPNISVAVGGVTYTETLPDPVITAGTDKAADNVPVAMTVGVPTITITYLSLSVTTMSWDANDGIAEAINTVLTATGSTSATLTSLPSWIYIIDTPYAHGYYNAGDTIDTGKTLKVYPATNSGASRSGYVVLTDAYGNTVSIAVSQGAPTTAPYISVEAGDPGTMPVYGTSGIVTLGSADIQVTFTPSNDSYGIGDHITTDYYIYKNGSELQHGTFIIRNKLTNVKSFTMTEVAGAADAIVFYVGTII